MADVLLEIAKKPPVEYSNVAISLSLLLIPITLSLGLNLEIASPLIIAASRCILQLSVVGLVLGKVFESGSIWAAAAVSSAMILLGTNEIVYFRGKGRWDGMIWTTLFALFFSVVPVSIIGSAFAMTFAQPFWAPQSFIPVLGMITGNSISATAISHNYIIKELTESRATVETYLAHGASRMEAGLPLVREALKLALLPTINQMSVIGLISIPGMMTGAILGGSSVEQAAKMQMVVMFLISSCSTLCTVLYATITLNSLIDKNHTLRLDKIQTFKTRTSHPIAQMTHWAFQKMSNTFKNSREPERERLLNA